MDVRSPLEVGASAPSFTAPLMSDGELTTVALDAVLPEGPTALAFYPAAFTGGCTDELCAIRDRTDDLIDAGFSVYGISTDLPFAQGRWIDQHSLRTPMVSDWDGSIIRAYGVVRDRGPAGLQVAQRSIFVIDTAGIVTDRWVRSGANPAFDPLIDRLIEGRLAD
jgi:peroxiredoxin